MTSNNKRQNWEESLQLGARGVADISAFLETDLVKRTWTNTHLVHNVEQDPRYQKYDIDLLWVIPVQDFLRCITVEVKTDRNHQTGNFFFETVSVEAKNSPGAFVITRAEWLFYYFIETGILYCFPMKELRAWFVAHEKDFPDRRAYSDKPEQGAAWSTVGKIVPIKRVAEAITGKRAFQKKGEGWQELPTVNRAI